MAHVRVTPLVRGNRSEASQYSGWPAPSNSAPIRTGSSARLSETFGPDKILATGRLGFPEDLPGGSVAAVRLLALSDRRGLLRGLAL